MTEINRIIALAFWKWDIFFMLCESKKNVNSVGECILFPLFTLMNSYVA